MVKPHLGGKAKKSLFYKLFIGGASLPFLFVPLIVQASLLNLLTAVFEKAAATANASSLNANSQTMPLLEAARNLNPNPPKGGGNITLADGVALVPVESPSGEWPDNAESPQSSQISVYIVREGDTLTQIAEMFDVTVNTIIWANDIKGRVIQPGQELVILPVTGIRHTVQKGETIATIAKKYEGDVEEIAQYNELSVGASLAVGDQIIIPDGVIAAPKTPKVSAGVSIRPPTTGATPASSAGYVNPLPGSIKTQGVHGYNGIDLGGLRAGSPVLASAAGTVIVAKSSGWNGGYGSYVVIEHNNGTQTLYAHLNSVVVAVSQNVGAGEQIGGVGNTGRSTGVHLHFEVRGAKNPF